MQLRIHTRASTSLVHPQRRRNWGLARRVKELITHTTQVLIDRQINHIKFVTNWLAPSIDTLYLGFYFHFVASRHSPAWDSYHLPGIDSFSPLSIESIFVRLDLRRAEAIKTEIEQSLYISEKQLEYEILEYIRLDNASDTTTHFITDEFESYLVQGWEGRGASGIVDVSLPP